MIGAPTPVLRSFGEAQAKAFYLDYLGFELVFEHRFEPGLPLYMGVRLGDCSLHLSEHHGDATPGAAVRIPCGDVAGFVAALPTSYGNARPGVPAETPWGSLEVTVHDPASNRLTFFSDLGRSSHG